MEPNSVALVVVLVLGALAGIAGAVRLRRALVRSLCGVLTMLLSMTAGIATSVLALIVSLQPILVGVLAPKFIGERIGARRWTGLLLGLAGAAGVIAARGPLHAESLGPVLLAVGALKRLRAADGTFGLVCAKEPLLKIFRITALDQVFPIYSSVDAATSTDERDGSGPTA